MNPRSFLNFLKSNTGKFFVFGTAFAVVVLVYAHSHKKKAPPITPISQEAPKPQIVETVKKDISAFDPPKEEAAKLPSETPKPKIKKAEKKAKVVPPISLYAATPSPKPAIFPKGNFAPYGRLVRCQLVVTVDSSSIETPIIGLVTDAVWHGNKEIIPVGTEVHGRAQVDRVRERIASSGNWNLVWQDGRELSVSGLALDRDARSSNTSWGITDGSAGLRGRLLKNDSLAEIKLFAATFLSGAADALTDREQTVFGTQSVPSLRNAPFEGAQEVLAVYAQQILQSIQRDGFYVRVPAGRQFYLYLTETVDLARAQVAGNQKRLSTDHLKNPTTRTP